MSTNSQKRLHKDMEMFSDRLIDESFRVRLVPALTGITRIDLREFLTIQNHTSCPPRVASEAADLIFRDTQGDYEGTVGHLQWAQENGWLALIDKRRGGKAITPDPEDGY